MELAGDMLLAGSCLDELFGDTTSTLSGVHHVVLGKLCTAFGAIVKIKFLLDFKSPCGQDNKLLQVGGVRMTQY